WPAVLVATSAAIVLLASFDGGSLRSTTRLTREYWSPYYRINYAPASRFITVNMIGHQQMSSREDRFPAYALPHLFNRDAGRPPFAQVVVVVAVFVVVASRAVQWGVVRVDAVEIDPAIYRLGRSDHPDLPYADGRV